MGSGILESLHGDPRETMQAAARDGYTGGWSAETAAQHLRDRAGPTASADLVVEVYQVPFQPSESSLCSRRGGG